MVHSLSALLLAIVISLGAQQPAFDVASIKPSLNGGEKMPNALTINPNGITFTNVTAMDCITTAYNIKDYQVTGPGWLKTERYDIVAKANGKVSDAEVRLMFQSLLADRFKLTVHRETKELRVFVVTLARQAAGLKPTEGGPENSLRFDGAKLSFRNYSISALTQFLSRLPSVDRPMVDLTALPGGFDFDLSMDVSSSDAASVKRAMLEWPTMFSDLQQQLGLKVDARNAPTEILVVDRVEKPTSNGLQR